MLTMLDDRHDCKRAGKPFNPAKFNWLLVKYEPLAGNSPIGICPWAKPEPRRPINQVRRRQLRAKVRNKAWRKLRMPSRIVKHRNRRTRRPQRNSI